MAIIQLLRNHGTVYKIITFEVKGSPVATKMLHVPYIHTSSDTISLLEETGSRREEGSVAHLMGVWM